MLRSEFNNIVKYLDSVIQQEVNKNKKDHEWLVGLMGLMVSKIYADGVMEDLNICSQYIKGKTILDFGAGSGLMALLFAHLGYEVKGIDIDDFSEHEADMATDQKAIWETIEKGVSHLEFKHYEQKIPYPDNFFDAVIAYAVIEHIPDSEIPYIMQEIKRVLKAGGILFISKLPQKLAYVEYCAKILTKGRYHLRLYGHKETKELLFKNSFDIIDMSFTDMFPAYPAKITNALYPFLKISDRLLLRTPLKYFAHDIRVVCINNK